MATYDATIHENARQRTVGTPAPARPLIGGQIRCLFETFFTLDAEDSVKRRVLGHLIAVAHKAAPSQGLQSLGGALVRRATESRDSHAAFFLSLVPPTVRVTRDFSGQREGACCIQVNIYILGIISLSCLVQAVHNVVRK